MEGGSSSHPTFNRDVTAMRIDDSFTDGEPQAGARTVRFCGEKWLKNALKIFSSDPHASIRNANRDIVAGGALGLMTDDCRVVSMDPPLGGDAEDAAARHGVEGIDQTIEQDLLQLGGVASDRRKVRGKGRRGSHLFAREDGGK